MVRPGVREGLAGSGGDRADVKDGAWKENDVVGGVAIQRDFAARKATGGADGGEEGLCRGFIPDDIAVSVGDEGDWERAGGDGFGGVPSSDGEEGVRNGVVLVVSDVCAESILWSERNVGPDGSVVNSQGGCDDG